MTPDSPLFIRWRDGFLYRERLFTLCGVKGTELFKPQRHGLSPAPVGIPDFRRFDCTYGLSEGVLFLEHIRLLLPYVEQLRIRAGKGPLLLGRSAWVEPGAVLPVVYQDLHTPVPFTGGMLLGHDYIRIHPVPGRELQVRESSLHAVFDWRELHELHFEEGHLTEARDCSKAAARLREALTTGSHEPGTPAWWAELVARLRETFREDYGDGRRSLRLA